MAEGFVGHHRPEVRSADPDVHDRADSLTRMADPTTVANALCKPGQPSKHLLHVAGHVMAFNGEGVSRDGSQRHMEHGSLLGGVDPLAAEHPLDSAAEIDLLRQFHEQPDGVVVDELLGVVEIKPARLGHEALPTAGIGGKHRSQSLTRRQATTLSNQAGPGGQIEERKLRHGKTPRHQKKGENRFRHATRGGETPPARTVSHLKKPSQSLRRQKGTREEPA